jgi:hypothetical protein
MIERVKPLLRQDLDINERLAGKQDFGPVTKALLIGAVIGVALKKHRPSDSYI